MIAAMLIALAVTVTVHEAGHAAVAQALGLPWRLVLTRYGPGCRIGSDDLKLTPRQVVLTCAGGPAANLLVAVLGVRFGEPFIAAFGLEFAFFNLLPLPRSDGRRIISPHRALEEK